MPVNAPKKVKKPRSNLGRDVREIATTFFSKNGYPSSTLRNIAVEAGVTAAAVYYHYNSKEEILRDIILMGLDRLTAVLNECLGSSNSPIEEVEALVRAHLSYCATFTDEAKIITEDTRFLTETENVQARAKQVVILEIYITSITRVFPEGELSREQARLLAFNTVSVILGWYRWYRPDHNVTQSEAINASVDFVMNSLKHQLSSATAT